MLHRSRHSIAVLLALLLAPVLQTAAQCGTMIDTDWARDPLGEYTMAAALRDFPPWRYVKRLQNVKVTQAGSSKYLTQILKKGCAGSDCGMLGEIPLTTRGFCYTRAYLEFTVRFGRNFDWVRGGKLPGLGAGKIPTGCTAVASDGRDGFSARIMWTDNECKGHGRGTCFKGKSGGMHIYIYAGGNRGCGREATFMANGKSVVIHPERDYKVRLMAKMNSPGRNDGEMKAWLNGQVVATVGGLRLRGTPLQCVDTYLHHVFFGGSQDMAALKDEQVMFKGIKVWGSCDGSGSSGARSPRGDGPDSRPVAWQPPRDDGDRLRVTTSVTTRFQGGACVRFTVRNTGATCRNYLMKLAMKPGMWKFQKASEAMKMVKRNDGAGTYNFVRSSNLNPEIKSGQTKSDTFCMVSNVKVTWSEGDVKRAFGMNAICNGA